MGRNVLKWCQGVWGMELAQMEIVKFKEDGSVVINLVDG